MRAVAVYTDYSLLTDEEALLLRKLIADNVKENPSKLRNSSVCVRAMLRCILKRYFDLTDFFIEADENGKPYIVGSNLHFNFSHSDGMALCVVSTEKVGCDVQSLKPFNSKVAARYYRDEEYKFLTASENSDEDFIKLWVLKEAILKQKGTGLSGGLGSYGFSEFISSDKFEAYGLKFSCFRQNDFYYAVCSQTDDVSVYGLDIKEIIKNLM